MAKKIKLHDKTGEQLIPVTRSTTVEMNDGVTLQTAYEGINSSHYTKAEINGMGYLQNYTETDPTVPSYVKGITETDITNWNNKADDALLVTLTGLSSQNDQGTTDSADGVYFTTNKTLSEINSSSQVNVLVPAAIASQFGLGSSNIIIYPDSSNLYQFFVGNTLVDGIFDGSDGGYARFYVESFKSFIRTSALKSDIDLYGGEVTNEEINNGGWDWQVPSIGVAYGGIQSLDYKIHRELNNASYLSSSSLNTTLSSYATSANYDSNTKKIYLKHGTTTLSEIDATDFIKDGMVDTAYVQGSNLVISFNTDAGKEAVNVPIANIFNANNYYTKSEIDNASYIQWDEKGASSENTNKLSLNNLNVSSSSDIGSPGNGMIMFTDVNRCFTGEEITDYEAGYGDDVRYSFTRNVKGDVAITSDITKAINSYVISASYLTSETDPTVPSHVKSITQQNITNWNNKLSEHQDLSSYVKWAGLYNTGISLNVQGKNGPDGYDDGSIYFNNLGVWIAQRNDGISIEDNDWDTRYLFPMDRKGIVALTDDFNSYVSKSDLNAAGYLQSFTETDPTVPSHVKSITQQNITDWNNKLSSETQLSKGTTTGSGNAVTDISVSNHQITLTKGSTFLTSHQNIKTINNQTITGTGNVTINELPTVSSSDNGKVLQVVNGVWTLVSPVTLYSGTGTPSNSQGNNGDLYMQI